MYTIIWIYIDIYIYIYIERERERFMWMYMDLDLLVSNQIEFYGFPLKFIAFISIYIDFYCFVLSLCTPVECMVIYIDPSCPYGSIWTHGPHGWASWAWCLGGRAAEAKLPVSIDFAPSLSLLEPSEI